MWTLEEKIVLSAIRTTTFMLLTIVTNLAIALRLSNIAVLCVITQATTLIAILKVFFFTFVCEFDNKLNQTI